MALLPLPVARAVRWCHAIGGRTGPARGTAPRPEASNPAGYAIEGSVFYVWDEDLRRACEWARELSGVALRRRGGARGAGRR